MHERILVVEDEPAIQELIAVNLRHAGFMPVAAQDAASARRAIDEALPDLVLLDWMLPDRSGIDLAREIRADPRTRALPLIMLTARAQEGDRLSGFEAGADDYVTKPFSPRELLARIRAVLRRAGAPPADATRFDKGDFVNNGADDDGSGSATLLGVAKAYASGPKPKRSVVFIWHVGEEAGLLGSRYNADFPVVPLEKVQAVLNMDMVGRDDCDNLEGDFSNSVFLVGDDRISTDLHNIIVQANQTMIKPLTLDYEMNDPVDPEGVYTRSDHYSYAAKGIPVAFFTTGLHPDYHRSTDSVEKILFPKMARIGQLMYESGFAIAATDKVLERDNKGPRVGFGTKAEVIKK